MQTVDKDCRGKKERVNQSMTFLSIQDILLLCNQDFYICNIHSFPTLIHWWIYANYYMLANKSSQKKEETKNQTTTTTTKSTQIHSIYHFFKTVD